METRICTSAGCSRQPIARGMCRLHYDRWYVANRQHMTYVRKGRPLLDVLAESFAVTDDCWLWIAGTDGKGYGAIRNRRAHVVMYELVVGPVPAGRQLDHLCRNRACINPDHLEPVTSRQNTLRGDGIAARNARKTRCPRGHAYDRVKERAGRHERRCSRCDGSRQWTVLDRRRVS